MTIILARECFLWFLLNLIILYSNALPIHVDRFGNDIGTERLANGRISKDECMHIMMSFP
jgi:hypothetical protein